MRTINASLVQTKTGFSAFIMSVRVRVQANEYAVNEDIGKESETLCLMTIVHLNTTRRGVAIAADANEHCKPLNNQCNIFNQRIVGSYFNFSIMQSCS